MAKDNKKTATATVAVDTNVMNLTEDNVMDQIHSKNVGDQSIAEQATKLLKDEQNERLVQETKATIAKAQYTNLKALLLLRKNRHETNAVKKFLSKTKELLDEFVGYTDEKGQFVNPTITKAEYEDKINEAKRQKRDDFRDARTKYETEYRELRAQYPEYWRYEWDD